MEQHEELLQFLQLLLKIDFEGILEIGDPSLSFCLIVFFETVFQVLSWLLVEFATVSDRVLVFLREFVCGVKSKLILGYSQ